MIPKVDGIFRTECVSFPRSGHHALKDVLAAYFGETFHYCEYYRDPEQRLDVCPTTNYQKNHDLSLDTELKSDRKYLVQIRNPLAAVQSWLDLDVRTNERSPLETHEDWHGETAGRLRLWNAFAEKWYCQRIPNRMIVQYERLLARPYQTCNTVLQFLTGVQATDAVRLKAALERYPLVLQEPRLAFWAAQA